MSLILEAPRVFYIEPQKALVTTNGVGSGSAMGGHGYCYGLSSPISRIGKLSFVEFLTWDFSTVFKDSSQQRSTHAEVSISPDLEIEEPSWPWFSKRQGSRVVLAVMESSADSRVVSVRSLVRIQQLASLAQIDLNHVASIKVRGTGIG